MRALDLAGRGMCSHMMEDLGEERLSFLGRLDCVRVTSKSIKCGLRSPLAPFFWWSDILCIATFYWRST
jgi:hypothetical protein